MACPEDGQQGCGGSLGSGVCTRPLETWHHALTFRLLFAFQALGITSRKPLPSGLMTPGTPTASEWALLERGYPHLAPGWAVSMGVLLHSACALGSWRSDWLDLVLSKRLLSE